MPGTLPDNALLLWLQDKSNDGFKSLAALGGMYTYFVK